MVELSIFLAAARPQNWRPLYDSLPRSNNKEFELIFVSPYDLPDNMFWASKMNIEKYKDKFA